MNNYQEYLKSGVQEGMMYSLLIPRDAMRGAAGYQLSNNAGSSLDFKDFREYEQGDDLRRIDWNAYARSDKLIVKLYREEVSPHLDLLIDASRSMNLAGSDKQAGLLKLSGLFSAAAMNSKCSLRAWSSGNNVQEVINGTKLAIEWGEIKFEGKISPSEAVHLRPAPRWRRHGIRVMLSDLMWEADPLLFLRAFAEGAAAVHIIQVLCRDEISPQIQGNSQLVDIELGMQQQVFIDAVTRRRYCEALALHQQQWRNACRQVGATFTIVIAEDVMEENMRCDALEQAQVLGRI